MRVGKQRSDTVLESIRSAFSLVHVQLHDVHVVIGCLAFGSFLLVILHNAYVNLPLRYQQFA